MTATYTRLHLAISCAAEHLFPMDVRLLVALRDAGGELRSDVLTEVLGCDSTSVRRSLQILYRHSLADGRGSDGGARRPGIRTLVSLTPAGETIADRALAYAEPDA